MGDAPQTASRLERILGLVILLLLLVGSLLVMLPFLSALAWAFVMAFSLWPAYRLLLASIRQRKTLAAMIMTLAISLVLVVPTVITVVNLTDDARAITVSTRRWLAEGRTSPRWVSRIPFVGTRAAARWDSLAQQAAQLLQSKSESPDEWPVEMTATTTTTTAPSTTQAAQQPVPDTSLSRMLSGLYAWGRQWVPLAGLAIVQGLTQILLSVFLTFFIFRDGAALGQRLEIAVQRIAGERGVNLLEVAGSTVRSVVYGILGTALVQGVMAGVGFMIAGVPGAALLGLVTFCLSPLPVGPPLVWIPASLWLFHQGESGWGIFMLVWGVAISSVDNIVKPWIISRGNKMPFILILFGVIGGAMAFGFIGVFLGPTLLAVAYRMIEQWSREPVQSRDQLTAESPPQNSAPVSMEAASGEGRE
jgi:predicted PurR-regulated permease PerM